MAVSARELIFYIRASNQASGAISRVIADIMALNRATDLANKKQLAQARVQTSGVRLSAAQRDLQSVKANVPAQQALLAAQAARSKLSDTQFAQGSRMLTQERSAFDLQTRRLQIQQRIAAIQPADAEAGFSAEQTAQLEIYDRQLQSIGMQEAVVTRNQTALAASTEKLAAAYATALSEQRRLQAAVNFNQIDPVALEAAQAKVSMAQAQYSSAVTQSENLARAQRAESIAQMGKYASSIEHVGRVAQISGAVMLAGFGAAALGAAKLQSSLVLAATQTTTPGRNTTAQVLANAQVLQNRILQIQKSGRSTASTGQQSAAAYQIFSSTTLPGNQNQQLQQGIKLLKEFNTVATANFGQVSLQDVTKAGTVIMNNFHTSVAQMPAALNTMQAAVRFGSLTMGQFLSTFNTLAPSFKAAGYSFTAMSQNIAAISRYFPNISTGAVGLARLTDTFGRYSDKFKEWGVTITDATGHLLPLNEIIQKIIDKEPGLSKGGVALQAFLKTVTGNAGTSQARKAFVTYAENLPQIDKLLKQVKNDNNELSKSFSAMQKSPGVQWAEFTNKLKALSFEIGIYAIPAFMQLGKPIANLVKWFDTLSPSTQRLIAKFGVFGGAGLLLTGTLLKVVGMGIQLVSFFNATGVGLTKLGGKFATAEARAATFRKTMMLLKGIGTIAIVVAVSYVISKEGQRFNNWLGSTSIGKKLGMGNVMPNFQQMLAAAKAGKLTTTQIETLRNAGGMSTAQEKQLIAATPGTLPFAGTGGSWLTVPKGWATMGQGKATGIVNAAAQTASWNSLYKAVKKAQSLMTANPQSLKDAQAYYDALDKLQKASTGNQFQAAESVLGNEKSTNNKRLTAAKTFAQDLKNLKIRNDSVLERATSLTSGGTHTKLLQEIKSKALQIDQEMATASTKTQLTAINVQVKALKKLEAEQKTVADDMKTYQTEAVQSLQQTYTNLLQQNQQAFGTLFQGPFMSGPAFQNMTQWGLVNRFGQATPRPQDLTKDLRSQVGQFNALHSGLSNLKKRGLPAGLLSQIEQQGTAAVPDIQALEKMTSGQLKVYARLWTQGQRDIQKATTIDFQPELKKWRVYGKEIAKAISQGISEDDFTIFKNLKSEILKELKPHPTVGHGKHPTVQLTPSQRAAKPVVYEYHVHGVGSTREAMTELKHMHFRNRNSWLM